MDGSLCRVDEIHRSFMTRLAFNPFTAELPFEIFIHFTLWIAEGDPQREVDENYFGSYLGITKGNKSWFFYY